MSTTKDTDSDVGDLSRGGGGAKGLTWELRRSENRGPDGSRLLWYPHGGYKWYFKRVGEGQVVFDSVEQMCETAPTGKYRGMTQSDLPRSVEYAVDQSEFSLRDCVTSLDGAWGGDDG